VKLTKHKILLIDDTPLNLQVLTAALAADFELQIATSGPKGLALAESNRPDLILLDVMMPGMDGHETCRRIKSSPLLQQVPVIFISALGQTDDESAGLALGAADYLVKPINVAIARSRIGNLLEREDLRREAEQARDHLEDVVQARTFSLAIAKEAAEAAHRAKTLFLQNMSHELRTPMNALMGQMDLLLFTATDARQVSQLDKANRAAEELLGLITRLFDMTVLEAGQLTLESKPFKLPLVLNGLSRLFEPEAERKRIRLDIRCDVALTGLELQGDAVRLGQILMNLIGNALKFTEQGTVSVMVTLSESSETLGCLLRFEVRDTGIGIALDQQQQIFGLFEQADNSTRRHFGGAGLGLPLSQQLVDLMGGQLGVESHPGTGALFWFTARLPTA
jgi:signal transduction histidine kinase